ncbi:MAG: Hpt domain-containing protein [Desulfosarcinaceae bacterium]|jgi:histidine phosphotransfer protein HptB
MNFKELGEDLGLDEDEYRELIELFIDTGSAEFDSLQAAFAESDFEQMSRSAHTIKGAAGNLGLMDVQSVAKIIEDNAVNKTLDGVAEAMQTLGEKFKVIDGFIHG